MGMRDSKICPICGYKTRKIWQHVKKEHGLSRKDYYDTYLKVEGDGICKECGQPTRFHGSRYLSICSYSCNAKFNNREFSADPVRIERNRLHLVEARKKIWDTPEKASRMMAILRQNGLNSNPHATIAKRREADPEYDRKYREQMGQNGFKRLHKLSWFQELRKEAASIQCTRQARDPNSNWGTRKNHRQKYKGIVMRSSWEVDFAKQMDKLDVVWEYEPVTFTCDSGLRYTPDFYLIDSNLFVELKPECFVDQVVIDKLHYVESCGYVVCALTRNNSGKFEIVYQSKKAPSQQGEVTIGISEILLARRS